MSKFDPYNTLGVPRDATEEDIRSAYKAKAKKTHPDAGGSADEFSKVGKAVAILTDPGRRKAFDEDGTVDDVAGQNKIDAAAMGILSSQIEGLIRLDDSSFKAYMRRDVLAEVVKALDEDIRDIKRTLADLKSALVRSDRVKSSVKAKNKKKNVFHALIEHHKKNIKNALTAAELDLGVRKRAREMALDHEFKPDKPAAPRQMPTAFVDFTST